MNNDDFMEPHEPTATQTTPPENRGDATNEPPIQGETDSAQPIEAGFSEDTAINTLEAVAPTEKIDQPNPEEAARKERERWRNGAEKFHKLWDDLSQKFPEQLEQLKRDDPAAIGQLQSLFLGNRAIIFKNSEQFQVYPRELQEALIHNPEFGLQESEEYIFNPDALTHIAQENPDILKLQEGQDPKEFLDTIRRSNDLQHATEMGVLLGFPKEDVEMYQSLHYLYAGITGLMKKGTLEYAIPFDEETQKVLTTIRANRGTSTPEERAILSQALSAGFSKGLIDIELVKSTMEAFDLRAKLPKELQSGGRFTDIYGVQWANYSNSPETRQQIEKLKQSFDESGILLPEQQNQAQEPNNPPSDDNKPDETPEEEQRIEDELPPDEEGEHQENDQELEHMLQEIETVRDKNMALQHQSATMEYLHIVKEPFVPENKREALKSDVEEGISLVTNHIITVHFLFRAYVNWANLERAGRMLPESADYEQVPYLQEQARAKYAETVMLLEQAQNQGDEAERHLRDVIRQLEQVEKTKQ